MLVVSPGIATDGATSRIARAGPHSSDGPQHRDTLQSAAAPPRVEKRRLESGAFLVANRNLLDPNFGRAVVLITHYDDSGTAGLIVNRRLQLAATEVVPALGNLDMDAGDLYMGGPVALNSLQFLIRVEAGITDALPVFSNIYLLTSQEKLSDLLAGRILGTSLRLYAGYAGWAPGQLENELLRGDWYLLPAESGYVFSETPESVWPELIERVSARWARIALPGRFDGMSMETQYNGEKIVPVCVAATGQRGWGCLSPYCRLLREPVKNRLPSAASWCRFRT
ncbi:MAG: YqgE/AlgH family protein, partial [Gammaproteobacteria bacterium]